jgi:hypothetical protein
MTTYFFNLVTPVETLMDMGGIDLPDEAAARQHAGLVADELMRHREASTRCWRLIVSDSTHEPRFELLFASVDRTMDHLTPELRDSVETLCSRSASLFDTIRALHGTLLEAKATMARAERQPYLAAHNGICVGEPAF